MSLEFAILNNLGMPEFEEPIPVFAHSEIINIAHELNLTLMLRVDDYYSDVEYDISEIADLINEFNCLHYFRPTISNKTSTIVSKCLMLLEKAVTLKSGIVAIAD